MREVTVAEPPRRVPFSVTTNALFGHWVSQLSWLAVGVSLIFFWIVTVRSELVTWIEFRGERGRVQGTCLAVEQLWDTEHDEPLYEVHYQYEVAGVRFEGASYGVDPPDPGAPVAVEYLVVEPSASRIEVMRRRRYPTQPFPALVALVAFGTACWRLVRGWRQVRLLRHGLLARGRAEKKRPAGDLAGKRFFEVTVVYSDPRPAAARGGPYRGSAQTQEYRVTYETFDEAPLTDQQQLPVLFDPGRPQRAAAVYGFPGLVEFDSDGIPFTHRSGVWVLVIPALTVVAHSIVALVWLVT